VGQIFVILVAMLFGIFLMVGDEVIGVMNPSHQLKMTWPLGLQFTIWQAWEIVFVVLLACAICYIVLIEYLLKVVQDLKFEKKGNL
jgi:hypothetical protein